MQNSYNAGSKTYGYTSSLATPIDYSYSTKMISGSMSPTTHAKTVTIARMSLEDAMSKYRQTGQAWSLSITSDMDATTEMVRLNDKLLLEQLIAKYFQLETDNQALEVQLRGISTPVSGFEVVEQQLIQAMSRKSKMEWSAEHEQLCRDYASYKAEAADWHTKLGMIEKARHDRVTKIEMMMREISTRESEIGHYRGQKAEFEERYKRKLAEIEGMCNELKRFRIEAEIERQTLARLRAHKDMIAAENAEYANFMHILRSKVMEVTTMGSSDVLQTEIQLEIGQIRTDYEESRRKLELAFRSRIEKFKSTCNFEQVVVGEDISGLRQQRDRLLMHERENAELRTRMEALKIRLHATESQRMMMTEQHTMETQRWEQIMRDLMAMQETMGGRGKLYTEVVIYKDILEGCTHQTQVQEVKKSEIHRFENATAGWHEKIVSLHVVDWEGRFVAMKNMQSAPISVGGWTIVQKNTSGGTRCTFTLPDIVIQPGRKLTIWSASENETSDGRENICYTGNWAHESEGLATELIDRTGHVTAGYSLTHVSSSSGDHIHH